MTVLIVYVAREIDSELIDVALGRGKTLLGKAEVGEPERGDVANDSLVIGDHIHAEVQVLAELLLLPEGHMKLLLENAVADTILYWHDEPVLLLHEAAMQLSKIAVSRVLHVQATAIA